MCGIAGFITVQKNTDLFGLLKKMVEVIRHKGPDDEGYYSDDYVNLGFCRLSILDLITGNQPLPNEN